MTEKKKKIFDDIFNGKFDQANVCKKCEKFLTWKKHLSSLLETGNFLPSLLT